MLPTPRLMTIRALYRRLFLLTSLSVLITLLALSLRDAFQSKQLKGLILPAGAMQPRQKVVDRAHHLTKLPATRSRFINGGIGNLALANVQWLDENALEAPLPTNLAPGRYALLITNPGGQTTVNPNAITLGKRFYLPIIER